MTTLQLDDAQLAQFTATGLVVHPLTLDPQPQRGQWAVRFEAVE